MKRVVPLGVTTVVLIATVITALMVAAQIPTQSRAKSRNTYLSPEAVKQLALEKECRQKGEYYLEIGQPHKAEECFRKAIEVQPGSAYNAKARYGLADALLAQGRQNEAIDRYRETLKRVGMGSPEFLLYYGKVCEEAHLPLEAARVYRRALASHESFPLILTGKESDEEVLVVAEASRGIYQHGKGDLQAAIATYRKVLDQNPDFTVVRRKLASALEEKGRPKEAQQKRAMLTRTTNLE